MKAPLEVLSILVAVSTVTPACTPAQSEPDRWEPFRVLEGVWEGTGDGFGATSAVSHRWEFVIQGSFLRLTTRSLATAADGTEELHEDVAYMSLDTDRGQFVFRQFLSEGYVNTYDVTATDADQPVIAFSHREVESSGGMRAQMHLAFFSPDEYELVLDLAEPGEEFVACQTMRMRRVSRE